MPDPRDPEKTVYPKHTLIWSAILLFLLALRSRRQFRFESRTAAFVANLNSLTGDRVEDVETAPHDDTLVYYLERVGPEHFESLPPALVRRLIRMKALDRWRLYHRFLVAVDGTGQLVFRHPHCPHCLTRKTRNGETLYYHPVLEAKLITAAGLVFSLATEFIENADPTATKQDCEQKAFVRLAGKVKARFPQLRMIWLADALYVSAPVFALCKSHRWDFIFTFKQGGCPALFQEYETLRDLSPKNRVEHQDGPIRRQFAWVNDLEHETHRLSAFECREWRPDGNHYFAWITNLQVGSASVITLANQGGRLRWKIENEGFNTQKNHGYAMEHAYSENEQAAKNFYFLLQIAHAFNQLMVHGSLLPDFPQTLGSLRNFYRRLAEALRNIVIPPECLDPESARAIQIRLDSS